MTESQPRHWSLAAHNTMNGAVGPDVRNIAVVRVRGVARWTFRRLPDRVRYRIQALRQGWDAGPSDPPEVFNRVYSRHEWGIGEDGTGSSGVGSTPTNAQRYVEFVVKFIADNEITSIVDIGCGDFQVGSAILEQASTSFDYHGIDVVADVVEKNQQRYGTEQVTFACRTISEEDPAPAADLYLIREVMQHLSFADIERLLGGCRYYRHMLISNCVRKGAPPKNQDMKSGSWSRREFGSGLWPHLPPINLDGQLVFTVDHDYPETEIQTVLVSS